MLFLALTVAQVLVTISPQNSPFSLPKNTTLYSAEACAAPAEQRARTISAAQIRQASEQAGLSFQDPSLNSTTLNSASRAFSRLLSVTKYVAAGMAVSGAIVSYVKNQFPNVGNAQTWGIISAGSGAVGAGIPIIQSNLQTAQSSAASVTTGVQSALISDMTAIYSVPVGSCSKSLMFFGYGAAAKPISAVLP